MSQLHQNKYTVGFHLAPFNPICLFWPLFNPLMLWANLPGLVVKLAVWCSGQGAFIETKICVWKLNEITKACSILAVVRTRSSFLNKLRCVLILRNQETWPKDAAKRAFARSVHLLSWQFQFHQIDSPVTQTYTKQTASQDSLQENAREPKTLWVINNWTQKSFETRGLWSALNAGDHHRSVCKGIHANANACLQKQAAASRPLPGPSEADRAGEFSFGRLELGGPTSSRFSAMVALSPSNTRVDKKRVILWLKSRSAEVYNISKLAAR